MKRFTSCFFTGVLAVSASFLMPACSAGSAGADGNRRPDSTGLFLINQEGYRPGSAKIALLRLPATEFEVVDEESGRAVYSGKTGKPRYWSLSGDTVRAADFSDLDTPGTYRLVTRQPAASSWPFSIGENVYSDITVASIRAFYFNRSGMEIVPEYGGKWARPAGHPDTSVLIHPSAASPSRPAGTVISSPGGWYDAGDYNKYMVNSGITTYTLLLFLQQYPEYCRELRLNIPESNNTLPDVADELLYNLKWMLTMQDPADGGVYHKLTHKNFSGFVMPHQTTEPRYVVQKSTAAALNFAAVTAMAARVLKNYPGPETENLPETCLRAARKAMAWAREHSDVIYRQPADIQTGEYGDGNLEDEWFWAETELALTREDPGAINTGYIRDHEFRTPTWNQVEMLGLWSLVLSGHEEFSAAAGLAGGKLMERAGILYKKYNTSPYLVSLDHFEWGSNAEVANQALVKLIAMNISGDEKYLAAIQGDVDYLLGRNATGYCFVTGFGSRSPVNIHHRPSGADGIPEPVPGFLVGGPNTQVMHDCGPLVKRSAFPARSYTDTECSYSTNEIAINWNVPFFYLMGAMDVMTRKVGL